MTKNPQIKPGNRLIIELTVSVAPSIKSSIKETATPQPNKIKSGGVNNPKINCPFFVFAGIK